MTGSQGRAQLPKHKAEPHSHGIWQHDLKRKRLYVCCGQSIPQTFVFRSISPIAARQCNKVLIPAFAWAPYPSERHCAKPWYPVQNTSGPPAICTRCRCTSKLPLVCALHNFRHPQRCALSTDDRRASMSASSLRRLRRLAERIATINIARLLSRGTHGQHMRGRRHGAKILLTSPTPEPNCVVGWVWWGVHQPRHLVHGPHPSRSCTDVADSPLFRGVIQR